MFGWRSCDFERFQVAQRRLPALLARNLEGKSPERVEICAEDLRQITSGSDLQAPRHLYSH